MPSPIINRRVVLAGRLYISPYILPWYNALSVKPSGGLLKDLNTLYDGMHSDGDLSEIDLIHPIAGLETDEQRLKPIKSTSGLDFTNVNAASLAVGGVTGDGATSYLNLNWIPATHGVKYTQNSAFYALYSRTNSAATSNDMGVDSGTSDAYIVPKFTDNNHYDKINDNTFATYAAADSLALRSVVRTASNAKQAFARGVSLGTSAGVSTGVAAISFFFCCRNLAGVPSTFSTRQLSFPILGSGAVNSLRVYNRIQAFMTARGQAV